ncbi:hypothetical protein Taro_037129 [Colocasia esculenta]|uniref:Uncharacterized protein n=1 Tax=Colocasia esculenta TaxID=4460 RepID=A0A843WA96_COLES|nr:hypothetical protein [Colocasia esculenta]
MKKLKIQYNGGGRPLKSGREWRFSKCHKSKFLREVGRLITSNVLIVGQKYISRVSREGRPLKSGREWRFFKYCKLRLLREVGRLITSNVLIEGQKYISRVSREARPPKSGREWRFFKCSKVSCLREMRLCHQAHRSSWLRSSSPATVSRSMDDGKMQPPHFCRKLGLSRIFSKSCWQMRMRVPFQSVKEKLYCSWTPEEGQLGYGGETLQAYPPPPTHRITTSLDLKFFKCCVEASSSSFCMGRRQVSSGQQTSFNLLRETRCPNPFSGRLTRFLQSLIWISTRSGRSSPLMDVRLSQEEISNLESEAESPERRREKGQLLEHRTACDCKLDEAIPRYRTAPVPLPFRHGFDFQVLEAT